MIHHCFGIFPSQKSGGKDKTMMNMMTGAAFNGAVAINGGVGVMEIRRPQMAGSVAQATEQMALTGPLPLWWIFWMKKMSKCWQIRNSRNCMQP